MAENRRYFIKTMATMGFCAPIASFALPPSKTKDFIAPAGLEDPDGDDFWAAVQDCFVQSPSFINLENGYFSPQPLQVLNAFTAHTRRINEIPSFYMRRTQEADKERVRNELAAFAGTDAEELALTRNTTESLNIIIQGYPFKKGDEVVLTSQDYGSMVEALTQRAQRDGIVLKIIDLPLHPKNDDEVVEAFEQAITAKTRLVLVTHMINTTGHILPVKKICAMAHGKGAEVMVDGAHTFAQLDFEIPQLGCDYYAASLHKWLCNPLGAGILWMKKEKIETLWPLLGDTGKAKTDIRRFEHYGTHPCAVQLTVTDALKFHNLIGSTRKEARLRYLKNYWVGQLQSIEKISFNTPADDARTCAIANVAIAGYSPLQLAQKLYDEYKIFTVAIESKPVNGVRITPHLYTTTAHLDALATALKEIATGKQ